MDKRDTLLEDTFTLHGMKFIVEVTEKEMLLSKDGKSSYRPVPANYGRGVSCNCIVATVRPNYGNTGMGEWSTDMEMHHREVEPLEVPKRGIIGYSTKTRPQERDVQTLAQAVIKKLKDEWNASSTQSLNRKP